MKILLVTEALVAGGAETFALRLARKLREKGHHCDLLCLNPDLEDPALLSNFAELPILRVPVHGLRWVKRLDRLLTLLGSSVSVQRLLSARWIRSNLLGRYDVYHTNLIGADRLLAELKRGNPEIRIVSTLHGDYRLHELGQSSVAERSRIAGWRRVATDLVHAIDRFVFIADEQRNLMINRLGVRAERLVRIYNGYEPPAPLPAVEQGPNRSLTFIMVARGLPEKGWTFLLDAFGRVQGDCRLTLVGGGEHLDALAKLYAANPKVRFAGFHPNPAALIQEADLFVFPSVYPAESLPTVIIEALYCGVPVIATDVGEVGRMLETQDGELAGTMLQPLPNETLAPRLAEAMQRYVDDPSLLSRHAALARSAFAKFDMDACAEAYLSLYRDVASSASGSSSSISSTH